VKGTHSEGGKDGRRVSLQSVERLSLYRKVLEELHGAAVEYVYSQQFAELARVTPAQLRRDLASFGSFGDVARGYNVYQLIRALSRILGTDERQTLALVGVGDLGRSLLSYRGFEERGFHVGLIFDLDQEKVGRVFAGRRCYPMAELEQRVQQFGVRIAILASRPEGLQSTVDRLGAAGVRSFLNFVPSRVDPPPGGYVEEIDISAKLEKLSFLGRLES